MCHRLFFGKTSHNKEYIENFCNDLKKPFYFACRKLYLYINPQCSYSRITPIRIRILSYIFLYLYKDYFVNFSKMVIDTGFKNS